jgi:hypothetical protein
MLFDEVTRDHAKVSCYFIVVTHIGLDHVGRYRETFAAQTRPELVQQSIESGRAMPVIVERAHSRSISRAIRDRSR